MLTSFIISVCWLVGRIKAQFVTDIGKGCKINCAGRQDIEETSYFRFFSEKMKEDKVRSEVSDVR